MTVTKRCSNHLLEPRTVYGIDAHTGNPLVGTLAQVHAGPIAGDLDGTNNACERLIGWWIKERYRLMRGYKRENSIRNVATLTARMGVYSGYYDMTELFV